MFSGKEVRILLKGDAVTAYLFLTTQNDKESATVLKSFERVKNILKENPQYGDPLKKERIPKTLKKLGIHNLYRVPLAQYWRMLYTIESDEHQIYIFVLGLMNHKAYDALLGYKKK